MQGRIAAYLEENGWALGVGRLNTDGADDFVVGSYAHVGDVGGAGLVTSGSGL